MKKIIKLFVISFLIIIFDKSFCQIDSLAKAKLDTLIYSFVQDIDSIKNLTPEKELKKIRKGPYETSDEYKARRRKITTNFSAYQRQILKEMFEFYSKKNILGIVRLDSVKYNPDRKIAKAFHRNIKIPNNRGVPKMDCFAYPVLKYPFAWKAKEGFGLTKTEINLSRSIARDNDIIKNKGFLEYTIKFFRGKNSMPSLRIISIKWKVNGKTIWNWRGNTQIPNGIHNKPLRGVS